MDIKRLYKDFTNVQKRRIYNMYLNYKLRMSYSGILPMSYKDWILSYSDFPMILKSIANAHV